MPFTYIIQSDRTGRFYIGSAINLTSRVSEHNADNTASTKSYRPWKLIYSEEFDSLQDARKRKREIKSWKNKKYMINVLGLKSPAG
jgi:putative endonuclease